MHQEWKWMWMQNISLRIIALARNDNDNQKLPIIHINAARRNNNEIENFASSLISSHFRIGCVMIICNLWTKTSNRSLTTRQNSILLQLRLEHGFNSLFLDPHTVRLRKSESYDTTCWSSNWCESKTESEHKPNNIFFRSVAADLQDTGSPCVEKKFWSCAALIITIMAVNMRNDKEPYLRTTGQ